MFKIYEKLVNEGFNKITINNEFIEANDVFIMLEGKSFDIYSIVPELLKTDIKFLVSQKELNINDPRIIYVPNTKVFLDGFVNYYQFEKINTMSLFGVTGTNGKTTTSTMYYDIVRMMSDNIGYLGTLGIRYKGVSLGHNEFTTPPINMLYQYFADMKDENIDHVVLETSAQAFDQNRLSKLKLDALAWLNFQELEHGEYYDSYDDYFEAKLLGFKKYLKDSGKAIVPSNDQRICDEVAKHVVKENIITFGVEDDSDICAFNIRLNKKYQLMDIKVFGKEYKDVKLFLHGNFAPLNLLVCIAYAYLNENVELDLFINQIQNLRPQKSNFEFIEADSNFDVVLDTTHTVDGFEQTLSFIKDVIKPKRLIHVFGCHGYRDESKRPIMGKTSEKYSDIMVLTSDYSRDESQQKIINAIKQGLSGTCKVYEDKSRKNAIELGISLAEPNDLVFISGKAPHEYEEFEDGSSIPFKMSDYECAINAIKEK